ncbi:MAG TPA: hypothetical protein DD440_07690 [Porticoccaceae bacterium]|nr:hypothetical protein [Porticoccaceae bacterium]
MPLNALAANQIMLDLYQLSAVITVDTPMLHWVITALEGFSTINAAAVVARAQAVLEPVADRLQRRLFDRLTRASAFPSLFDWFAPGEDNSRGCFTNCKIILSPLQEFYPAAASYKPRHLFHTSYSTPTR